MGESAKDMDVYMTTMKQMEAIIAPLKTDIRSNTLLSESIIAKICDIDRRIRTDDLHDVLSQMNIQPGYKSSETNQIEFKKKPKIVSDEDAAIIAQFVTLCPEFKDDICEQFDFHQNRADREHRRHPSLTNMARSLNLSNLTRSEMQSVGKLFRRKPRKLSLGCIDQS